MIKKTFCFSNPAYLSLRDAQLVIKLPEAEKADNLTEAFKKTNEVTRPIEDIGVVVLDHKQITITDKQFGNIELFFGTKPQQPNAPGQQLELF